MRKRASARSTAPGASSVAREPRTRSANEKPPRYTDPSPGDVERELGRGVRAFRAAGAEPPAAGVLGQERIRQLDHDLRVLVVAACGERRFHVDQPDPGAVADLEPHAARLGEEQEQRMVERQQPGLELGRPIEVEQPAPQLTRRFGRRRDSLDDGHLARRGPVLPLLLHVVDRVPRRLAVELEQCEPLRGLRTERTGDQPSSLPPRVRPAEETWTLGEHLLIQGRERTRRLVDVDETEGAARLERLRERRVLARQSHLPGREASP